MNAASWPNIAASRNDATMKMPSIQVHDVRSFTRTRAYGGMARPADLASLARPMAQQQQEIETILARQLASYLSTPAFLVGRDGTLLFYNEAAERILGRRFSETGALGVDEWSTAWTPTSETGDLIAPGDLPLVIALRDHAPAVRVLWITGHDGVRRHITIQAFPLMGIAGGFVGAVALFWEMP